MKKNNLYNKKNKEENCQLNHKNNKRRKLNLNVIEKE